MSTKRGVTGGGARCVLQKIFSTAILFSTFGSAPVRSFYKLTSVDRELQNWLDECSESHKRFLGHLKTMLFGRETGIDLRKDPYLGIMLLVSSRSEMTQCRAFLIVSRRISLGQCIRL